MTVVVDTSAVLAILKNEPGGDIAVEHSRGAELSAVNLVEVRSKMMDVVTDVDRALATLNRLEIRIVAFTVEQGRIAADLWSLVQGKGISLGDRACMALALDRGAKLVTADRDWARLNVDINFLFIR